MFFIVGLIVLFGRRMGYVGVIIAGGKGGVDEKIVFLKEVGVIVIMFLAEIGKIMLEVSRVVFFCVGFFINWVVLVYRFEWIRFW